MTARICPTLLYSSAFRHNGLIASQEPLDISLVDRIFAAQMRCALRHINSTLQEFFIVQAFFIIRWSRQ